ncbi:uncharacterized protein LOC105255096 [Camponotus floridanus]|uniref:uncharacterized protein LOC105255096 n=1 Tax=Camponotus floridanus TaxID=104421 RepID=UPI00059E216D|nr:uncharacterized protein LOC105255096 [Camponotus floridanus]
MRKTFILTFLYIGLAATSDLSGYEPRGWRPNGQRFNPNNNQLHAYYGAPRLQSYEPSDHTTASYRDPFFTTTTSTTTPRPPTTTTTPKTTTTPRSREPTTPLNEQPEEDFNTNPLAIANSFAFNRPVYIYNAFPFLPVQIITQ